MYGISVDMTRQKEGQIKLKNTQGTQRFYEVNTIMAAIVPRNFTIWPIQHPSFKINKNLIYLTFLHFFQISVFNPLYFPILISFQAYKTMLESPILHFQKSSFLDYMTMYNVQQGQNNNTDTFAEQKERLKEKFKSSYFTVDYWSVNLTSNFLIWRTRKLLAGLRRPSLCSQLTRHWVYGFTICYFEDFFVDLVMCLIPKILFCRFEFCALDFPILCLVSIMQMGEIYIIIRILSLHVSHSEQTYYLFINRYFIWKLFTKTSNTRSLFHPNLKKTDPTSSTLFGSTTPSASAFPSAPTSPLTSSPSTPPRQISISTTVSSSALTASSSALPSSSHSSSVSS